MVLRSFRAEAGSQQKQAKALIRRFRKAAGEVNAAADAGIVKAAGMILVRSLELTPIDTGRLRASSFIKREGGGTTGTLLTTLVGKKVRITVGYNTKSGGQFLVPPLIDAPYAVGIHNAVERNFKEPGTQALFLQTAVNEIQNKILGMVAAEVSASLRGVKARGRDFPKFKRLKQ